MDIEEFDTSIEDNKDMMTFCDSVLTFSAVIFSLCCCCCCCSIVGVDEKPKAKSAAASLPSLKLKWGDEMQYNF